MFELNVTEYTLKQEFYEMLIKQLEHLIEGEKDEIANMANVSSLLYWTLNDVNWAGFYLYKDGQLVLGPFQGKPACIRIPIGRGVCGTAAHTRQTQLVKNVHEFPGHIACDSASNSEIVIPMVIEDRLLGVLDIDSPILERFDEIDKEYLEKLVNILINACNWN